MNKIEQLLQKYCPDGVEFLEIGEIANFRRGSFPQPYGETKWYNGDGAMPFVQVADVTNKMKLVEDTKQKISKLAQSKSVFVPKGTVIVTLQGSIGRVAITQYDSYIDRTLGIFESYKNEIDIKYFAYQLESIFNIEKESARGSTIKTITKAEFTKFQIPIPPIEIQKEIVKILDTFTLLEAELEAELEARKKQYEYYRDNLLSFGDDEVEWKELGEVANYSKTRISSSELNNENYVGVDNLLQNKQGKTISSYVPTSGNLTKYEFGDILIGNIRPYLKKIWRANNTGGTNGDVLVIRIKDTEAIISEYLYYLLASDSFFHYNMQNSKGAKMPRGDKDSIMKFKIPVPYENGKPDLQKQQEIVAILDKFDALVNDISVGLPAELKARRQQYEYYRNKLLDFKVLEK